MDEMDMLMWSPTQNGHITVVWGTMVEHIGPCIQALNKLPVASKQEVKAV